MVLQFVLAMLLAPLAPGLAAVPDVITGNIGMASWYIGFSAIAGYASLLVVGLPLFVRLGKRQPLRFIHYVMIGLICGMVAYLGAFVPGAIVEPHAAAGALLVASS